MFLALAVAALATMQAPSIGDLNEEPPPPEPPQPPRRTFVPVEEWSDIRISRSAVARLTPRLNTSREQARRVRQAERAAAKRAVRER